MLVTTGEVSDPVIRQIEDRNKLWVSKGYPRLELLQGAELVKLFAEALSCRLASYAFKKRPTSIPMAGSAAVAQMAKSAMRGSSLRATLCRFFRATPTASRRAPRING